MTKYSPIKLAATIALILSLFAMPLIATESVTPDEFDTRISNILEVSFANLYLQPPEDIIHSEYRDSELDAMLQERHRAAIEMGEKIKAEFRAAYLARQNGNNGEMESHLNAMDLLLSEWKQYLSAKITVDSFKESVVNNEFRPSATPIPDFPAPTKIADGANPTIRVIIASAQPSKKIIPKVSEEQLRGRKNFLIALMDLIWDNGIIIGLFLIGMLVMYALYNREEEEPITE